MLAARGLRPLACTIAVVVVAACTSGRSSHTTARAGAWLADQPGVRAMLDTARSEIAATSSYDYRRLDRFRSAIRKATTTPLTGTLMQTVDTAITKTGKQMRVVQTATVEEIGVGAMTAGSTATVLAVGSATVRSTKYPTGHEAPFDVVAQLRNVGGRWVLSALQTDGSFTGDLPGTPDLGTAAAAARHGLQALLTFHRAHFAADFGSALAATTGALRRQLAGQRASTLRTIQQGGYDLVARVRAIAVESARGATVTVLAQLAGFRVMNGRSSPSAGRSLHATVVRSGGRWLLSDVGSVHSSG